MVFQNYALYPHMSVYDNMAFGLKMRKFPKAEIQKRVQDAAEILGIQELLKRKPRQLSGGQRQRSPWAGPLCVIPRSSSSTSRSPTSTPSCACRCAWSSSAPRAPRDHRHLRDPRPGRGHDLGSRVVVMKDGWVQQVGEPMEIYAKPQNKFVAGFIGSPSMNFISVTLTDGSGALFAEASGIKIKVPPQMAQSLMPYKGQMVTLGVRPRICGWASSDSSDLSFEAVVEVVEPLGAEILLDTKAANQQIVARVEPSVKTNRTEKIR
jgi:multiple sugar transport system ATP-binding protein